MLMQVSGESVNSWALPVTDLERNRERERQGEKKGREGGREGSKEGESKGPLVMQELFVNPLHNVH